MSTAFGTNAWLGFAEETTFGTAVSPTKFIEIASEKFGLKQSWNSKPTLRNASQFQKVRSKKSVEGGFKANFGFSGFERLLKHAMGGLVTTGVGPYTQTFSLATVLPTGLTFHVNRDSASLGATTAFQYAGCQIEKLSLKQGVEDILQFECDIVGTDMTNVSVATPTFPTFEQADWELVNSGALAWHGIAAPMLEFEIMIENNLAKDRYKLAQRTRLGLGRNGPRKVSGKFKIELADLNIYADYKNLAGPQTLVFAYDNLGSGTASRTMTITVNAVLQGDDPNVSDAGPVTATFNFEGFATSAGNDELSIVLVNNTSTP